MTSEEGRALFDVVVLRCPECGHDYDPDEVAAMGDADWPLEECPGCNRGIEGAEPVPFEVNLLDELDAARRELVERGAMIVDRIPALGPRVAAAIAEADEIVAKVLR